MNVIRSMRNTVTRLFVISVLSLTSHNVLSEPLQPGLLVDPQFQACLEQLALVNGWTLTEEVTSLSCSDREIQQLDGLEVFSNLVELDVSANNLYSSAFIDSLLQLQKLNLSNNKLYDIYGLQFMHNLTHLNLSGNNKLSPFYVQRAIESNPGLTHLGVAGINFGNLDWLPPVGFMGEYDFIELDISEIGVISDLRVLSRYSKLRVLKASGNGTQSLWLMAAAQIQVLDLSNNQLVNINNLNSQFSLINLNLSGNDRIDTEAVKLLVVSNSAITHLNVAGIPLGDLEWISSVGPRGQHEYIELNISQTGVFPDLYQLNQYPNLRVLKAAGNHLKSASYVDLLSQLEVLDLSHNNIVNISNLQLLHTLKQLDLSHNTSIDTWSPDIDIGSLNRVIQANAGITHLSIAGINIVDLAQLAFFDYLFQLTADGLIELDISDTGVIDISRLSEATNLQVLKAGDNSIEHLWGLELLQKLKVLELNNNRLNDVFPLQYISGLKKLNLSNNKSTTAISKGFDLFSLNQVIRANPNISHLGLSGISIKFLGELDYFGFANVSADNLIELDVSHTDLDELSSLNTAYNLRVLVAAENNITNLWGLENLQYLQVLDLSNNKIEDIYPLQQLNNLTHINLSNNQSHGAIYIDLPAVNNVIQYNPGITHLEIAGIPVPDLSQLAIFNMYGPSVVNNLIKLDISRTEVMDLGPLLRAAPNLRTLYAADNLIKNVNGIEILQTLTALDLSNNHLEDISQLTLLHNLTELKLSNNIPLNSGLVGIDLLSLNQVIQSNPGITRLGIAGVTINDISQLAISSWDGSPVAANLIELDISNTGVTSFIGGSIYEARNLQILKAANNKFKHVVELEDLVHLQVLDVSHNNIADIYPLRILHELTQLNISNNLSTDPDMPDITVTDLNDVLLANPGITHLGIAGIQVTDLGQLSLFDMASPAAIEELIELDISRTGVTDISQIFYNALKLRILEASDNSIRDLTGIEVLQNLEVLNLANNQIGNVSQLMSIRKLTQLNVSNNVSADPFVYPNIDLNDVNHIVASNPGITHLGMAGVPVSELNNLIFFDMYNAAFAEKLIELDISRTLIRDIGSIRNARNLRVLKASDNFISNTYGLDALEKLEILDLSGNHINNVVPLIFLHNLKQLNLSNNKLIDPSVPGINLYDINMLTQSNPGITHLGIAGVQVSDLSQLALFDMSVPMASGGLIELDISNTGVMDVSPLTNAQSLRVLKLSHNAIQDVSGFEFLQNLQVLDLSNNSLRNISSLKLLHELKQLNLSNNNPVNRILYYQINQITIANPGITHLGIAGSWVDDLDYLSLFNPGFQSTAEHLIELDISNTAITDFSLLSKLPGLRVLKASGTGVEQVWGVESLQLLEELDLSSNHIIDIEPIKALYNLRKLNLSNNEMLDPFFPGIDLNSVNQVIDMNPGLTHLNIAGVYIGIMDQLSLYINGMSHKIVELDVSDSGITNINAISGMVSLRVFKAAGNFISDVQPLFLLEKIEVLDLSNNDIQFVLPLGDLANLVLLDLRENNKINCSELDELEARLLIFSGQLIRPLNCILFTKPSISIISPVNWFSDYQTNIITLVANATDVEDGNINHLIQWSSNLDGVLGTGGIARPLLKPGAHVVSASITDSHGNANSTTVNITVLPNTAPNLQIYSVNNGAIFSEGESIVLSADAIDMEDGNISANIEWRSSIDGILTSGASIQAVLTVGVHSIRAIVRDSTGAVATKTVSITINGLPQLNILSPVEASLHQQGSEIVFSASASDAEDGVLDSNILWSSNLDAMLGAGAQLTQSLSAGSHIITASITDISGATVVKTVTVSVNALPQVTLLSPLSGSLYQQGDSVSFAASATDAEDGVIEAGISWSSSLDGVLGSGLQFTKVLSIGSHIITASVTDSAGITATQSVTVSVNGLAQLSLLAPTADSLFQQGDSIAFSATASDIEDGILSAGIVWSSNIDGVLGTAAQLTNVLSVGSHIITASITDSAGISNTQTVTVNVNGLPQVTLLNPLNSSLYQQGDSVSFAASATDAEDGVIETGINWISSLDGVLGSGIQFTKVLSVGSHIITASVTDSEGITATQSVTVSVNGLPQLSLLTPTAGSLFQQGESITFSATASDLEDGVIDANINWSSSLDGIIDTASQFTKVLSVGEHIISATITDANGASVTQTIALNVNGLPQLTLLSPLNGTLHQQADTVTLSATASDIEDGILSESVTWVSSIDGILGTGAQLTSVLSVGSHTITVSITDSAGAAVNQTATVVINGLPQLTLQSPANASVFKFGDTITFTAVANDAEDGLLDGAILWSSNLDGVIGNGATFSRVLTPGNHIITIRVLDSAGGNVTRTVNVTVNENVMPVLTVQSPSDGDIFQQGSNTTFYAVANDLEDGDLTAAISWSSNIDGLLGAGSSLSYILSAGNHVITAEVIDLAGASTTKLINVIVNVAPQLTLQAPLNGSLFMLQELVELRVIASDLEDGDISSMVQWSSNLDGFLGTGGVLTKNLSLGAHILTASITDSFAGVHSVTTQLVIDQINLGVTVSNGFFRKKATLTWSGSRTEVDIYKNGSVVNRSTADGSSVISFRGLTKFKVCETTTNNCSVEVVVE